MVHPEFTQVAERADRKSVEERDQKAEREEAKGLEERRRVGRGAGQERPS